MISVLSLILATAGCFLCGVFRSCIHRTGRDIVPGVMANHSPLNFRDLLNVYRSVINAPPVQSRGGATDHSVRDVLCHIRWMLEHMPDRDTDPEKFSRWLGFVQCSLWVTGIYTLDQLRSQTRRAAQEDTTP